MSEKPAAAPPSRPVRLIWWLVIFVSPVVPVLFRYGNQGLNEAGTEFFRYMLIPGMTVVVVPLNIFHVDFDQWPRGSVELMNLSVEILSVGFYAVHLFATLRVSQRRRYYWLLLLLAAVGFLYQVSRVQVTG